MLCEIFIKNIMARMSILIALLLILNAICDSMGKPAIIEKGANITPTTLICEDVHMFPGSRAGRRAVLEKGVVLESNAHVGDYAFLGRYSRARFNATLSHDCHVDPFTILGSFSKIIRSRMGFRSIIGNHTELDHSVLKRRVYVAPGVKLVDAYIGDNGIIYSGTLVPDQMITGSNRVLFESPDAIKLVEMVHRVDPNFHNNHIAAARNILAAGNFAHDFGMAVSEAFNHASASCAISINPHDNQLKEELSRRFAFLIYVYLLHFYGEQVIEKCLMGETHLYEHQHLFEDVHFGCSGSFKNALGDELTKSMKIAIAISHDAHRSEDERVKVPNHSFCYVATRMITRKLVILAIDGMCVKENKHKCYDDCGPLHKDAVGSYLAVPKIIPTNPKEIDESEDSEEMDSSEQHEAILNNGHSGNHRDIVVGNHSPHSPRLSSMDEYIWQNIADNLRIISDPHSFPTGLPIFKMPIIHINPGYSKWAQNNISQGDGIDYDQSKSVAFNKSSKHQNSLSSSDPVTNNIPRRKYNTPVPFISRSAISKHFAIGRRLAGGPSPLPIGHAMGSAFPNYAEPIAASPIPPHMNNNVRNNVF